MGSELQTEYEQVNQNFRSLADIRFKLLALVPTVGGAAVFLLAQIASDDPDHPLIFAISILGFMVTMGITFYDLRNSQLYNRLIDRARFIEKRLMLPANPNVPKSSKYKGGQFLERPQREKRLLFIKFGHDTGLALIYAPTLGAWFFPATLSILTLSGYDIETALTSAYTTTSIATILFLEEFLRIDGFWRRIKGKLSL